ncbi:RICIN domain-containing protein [Streptomyces sp. NPDC006544]|uniref:RICIN domain-containing protein n=1 Tax=Streptomyces sp. NPDC006544 TaxID=3154583 RepID=UPI0033AFBBB0
MKSKVLRSLGRFAAVGALVIGFAGVGAVSATPASAASNWFNLVNGGTNMCMHASSGGEAGAWVTQEDCNFNEPRQRWTWNWDGAGRKVLRNWSGYCLEGYNGENPGTLIVWNCTGVDSQAWYWGENYDLQNYGYFSGRSVEVPGKSHNPGTQLILWPTNGTSFQRWIAHYV